MGGESVDGAAAGREGPVSGPGGCVNWACRFERPQLLELLSEVVDLLESRDAVFVQSSRSYVVYVPAELRQRIERMLGR